MSYPSPVATYHKTTYPALDPKRPELSANGKTIVVTGGGAGIGAEIAKYFAKASASKIIILGRRETHLLATQKAIAAEHPNVQVLVATADVTKKDQVDAAFAKTLGASSKVDVLVSNAGILGARKLLKELDVDELFAGIETNVKGSFNVCQTFLHYAAADAVVVEISSGSTYLNSTPDESVYAISKAASLRLFDRLKYEHPELTVYHVQPGVVATNLTKEAGWDGTITPVTKEQEEFLKIFDHVSLPASYVVWLASPEARFLKGKFVYSNWDVEELAKRKDEIENGTLLDFGLVGWPFS